MPCNICEGFDIRELYALVSNRASKTKPMVPGIDGFPEVQGFPNFYTHHKGLSARYSNANEGCDLCTSIWQQCSRTLPPYWREQQTSSPEGEYREQIMLALSNWSPEAQGMPYLVIKQHLARGAVRDLPTFDVFMERDMEKSICIHCLNTLVPLN